MLLLKCFNIKKDYLLYSRNYFRTLKSLEVFNTCFQILILTQESYLLGFFFRYNGHLFSVYLVFNYCLKEYTCKLQDNNLYFVPNIGVDTNGWCPMFLMRMCLGDIYMTNQSSSGIRRPPCKKCGLQVCTSHQELFDSVVANLMYREFVVYDRCQTYPEYIIWYKWTIEKLNYSKISRKDVCHFFFIVSIICIQNKPKRWRHAYLFQNWKKMFINFQDFKKVFIWFFSQMSESLQYFIGKKDQSE